MELYSEFLFMVALSLLCSFVFFLSYVVVDLLPSLISSSSKHRAVSAEVGDCEHNVFDESPEREQVCEIQVELVDDYEVLDCGEEIEQGRVVDKFGCTCGANHCDHNVLDQSPKREVREEIETSDEVKEGTFDDWEGIERSELERHFGSAEAFVASKDNAHQFCDLNSAVKMQLYGLHKIATQGQCPEAQPMAFTLSARAQWNAWHRLGNMIPEVAME